MDLFVRLHGMLFTKIQLDDFSPVMSRYMERLEEDASLDGFSRKATITQVDWMLMATVNVAAVLQYGAATGVVRTALSQEGQERRRQHAVLADDEGDLDGDELGANPSPPLAEEGDLAVSTAPPVPAPVPSEAPITPTFIHALELAFSVFKFVLAHPTRSQGIHSVLNPYVTIFLTFLATLFRQSHVGAVLRVAVPWKAFVDFVNTADIERREETRLAGGAPLPEDWAVRGMDWVGRRVYERGFWKGKGSGRGSVALAQPRVGERFQSEMDVLLAEFDSAVDITEGVVDEVEGADLTDGPVAVHQRRGKRVSWAAGVLARHVDGLEVSEGMLVIEGALKASLAELESEKAVQVKEKLASTTEDNNEEVAEVLIETDSDNDDPELTVLKVGRIYVIELTRIGSSTPPPILAQCSCQEGAPDQAECSQILTGGSRIYYAHFRHQRASLRPVPLFKSRGRWSVERHSPSTR